MMKGMVTMISKDGWLPRTADSRETKIQTWFFAFGECSGLQDNLKPDNLAPDNLAPDNLAPGQFGTNIIKRTIWHQEKNDIQIIIKQYVFL